MKNIFTITIIIFVFSAVMLTGPNPAAAATAEELNREADQDLQTLCDKVNLARMLSKEAKGILVFPSIVKAGLVVGAQYGEGVLMKEGKPAAYYRTTSASYGLQAGIQEYSYALFFMTDSAMNYLEKSKGWELGVGPSIVVVDMGAAKSLTTTTAKSDIYAFFFDQKGLMAGLGLQGTKITKINK